MTKHTVLIRKEFAIRNRKKQFIKLPLGYKLHGVTTCFVEDYVEKMTIHAMADNELIEEETVIQGVPCSCVKYSDSE